MPVQNWDDFRFVLALSNAGSMSLAAKYLNTDATTVSRRVNRLSSEYGLNLFRKTKGSWLLTNAGEEFVRAASEFNHEISRLRRVKEEALSGIHVTLNSSEFIVTEFLAPNIAALDALKSGFSLSLEASDRRISLAYGEADMALRLIRPRSGRLIGSKVGSIPMRCYTHSNAEEEKWVGLPQELDWTPEMQLGAEIFGRPPDIRVPNFDAMRKVAESLKWGAVGPNSIFDESGSLSAKDEKRSVTREIWAVIHESRRDDQSLKIVREWVRTCLR